MFGIDDRPCPCGSLTTYGVCCGRLHRGAEQAATPVELMRSRYSAYAVGDADYVWRTWHPSTRPDEIELDGRLTWTGLEIRSEDDEHVEFVATYVAPDGAGQLHERSRFQQRAGRWFYLDGELS
ncbi:YchJ family protein [Nocardioides sp. Kera G14]|uniref:YchJ family protein n=1 Tax=Nocardioides sp. Kera G14 TaxID=2884264 RepID=UPI001D1300DB|nr:YchJ family metal-binding protein [Nocardioides sp. Kera G14]UDY22973.1 SEC-C domain-containing protein [Nocardioides sp. Kera G14]